ncbi:hypothetical protein [Streptomyces luteogriseus]|uniref:hypothetical protein n=1 Tax=Streptomyces luteogriseus TaxID=68233 RepID=UPI0037B12CB3
MSDFPPGIIGPTIRHALVFNLLDAHRRVGDDLPACDLHPETIRALKWQHSQNLDKTVRVVWHALEEVTSHTGTEGGPTAEAA